MSCKTLKPVLGVKCHIKQKPLDFQEQQTSYYYYCRMIATFHHSRYVEIAQVLNKQLRSKHQHKLCIIKHTKTECSTQHQWTSHKQFLNMNKVVLLYNVSKAVVNFKTVSSEALFKMNSILKILWFTKKNALHYINLSGIDFKQLFFLAFHIF